MKASLVDITKSISDSMSPEEREWFISWVREAPGLIGEKSQELLFRLLQACEDDIEAGKV